MSCNQQSCHGIHVVTHHAMKYNVTKCHSIKYYNVKCNVLKCNIIKFHPEKYHTINVILSLALKYIYKCFNESVNKISFEVLNVIENVKIRTTHNITKQKV